VPTYFRADFQGTPNNNTQHAALSNMPYTCHELDTRISVALVARQPWSIFACMNSSRQKRVRLLRCVRSASSTKHCGRAAETFATLLSQPLTRLWHRDVLGLPVPSMFSSIVTGGSGVTRINRGAYLLGSLRHGRLATKHRGVHVPA